MADQNITELPIKTNTGVVNTDYMLGIDASEGYQILVRDVAKYIVENYNGSTLAGSAQTPKSAIDALNSNKLITPVSISSGSFDDIIDQGVYATSSALTEKPTNAYGKVLVFSFPSNGKLQVAFMNNYNDRIYYRHRTQAGAWNDWFYITATRVTT